MKKYRIIKGGLLWRIVRITPAIFIIATSLTAADALQPVNKPQNIVTAAVAAEHTSIVETEVEEPAPELYEVPLDAALQLHIISLCEEYDIDPRLILAMIQRESSFRQDAMGDEGKSYGLMQVQKHNHLERMKRLNVTDLLNPYQNVIVGIDIIAEKIAKYDTLGEALTAYNAGDGGAYKYYFSQGIYANNYAKDIMATMNTY